MSLLKELGIPNWINWVDANILKIKKLSESLTILDKLLYNEEEDTISYKRIDGGTREFGKEISDNYTNLDTVPIVNGDICSIVSATGNRSAVKLTDVTNDSLSLTTLGMCTVDSISVNGDGEIAKVGKVHGLNTQDYVEGTELFVDPLNKGKWTNIKPTGYRVIRIGVVVVSHINQGIVELGIVVYPFISDLQEPMNELIAQEGAYTYPLLSSKENIILNSLPSGVNSTLTIPTPIVGRKNESVLHFTTGSAMPTLVYSGFTPIWLNGIALSTKINKSYTIVFEQVRIATNTWIVKTSWGEY